MAMVCIAVSFLVMIIAVAVSNGFRSEIRNSLSEISGDVQLTPVNMNYMGEDTYIERHPAYLPHIQSLEAVKEVIPAIYRAGIVKHGEQIHGVVFKAVPQEGRADSLASLEVSIPSSLASLLSLEAGDSMISYFVGERVKLRKFRIASVYNSLSSSDEQMIIQANITDFQRLNGWSEEQVSALEVQLKEEYRTVSRMDAMADEIGFMAYAHAAEEEESVVATSLAEKYPQLFDWLDLIDFNVLFILILMTIVAGFNMISGLLIMLFEHISTIGILKSMGMTDKAIAKVFLRLSSSIVLKGMLIGNLAAIAFCLIQGSTHLLPLDSANYYISFVPVRLNWMMILAADLVSYAVIMLLLLIPSLFIAKVDPAKTVAVR